MNAMVVIAESSVGESFCGVSPSSVELLENSKDVDSGAMVDHGGFCDDEAGHSLDAGNGPIAKHQTLSDASSSFVYAHPSGQSASTSLNLM